MRNLADKTAESFRLPEPELKRGAELIADVLSKSGRIFIADFSSPEIETERFAEDFKRYFGSEKIILGRGKDALQNSDEFPGAGDLLIGIAFDEFEESAALSIMQARQRNCRIMFLADQKSRKLAALSDVCLMSEPDSPENNLRYLRTVGFLLFQAIERQTN